MSDIAGYLSKCGYPIFKVPVFDDQIRQTILAKLRSRSRIKVTGPRAFDQKVFFVMPFSPGVKQLRIKSSFRKHLCFTGLELTLAWTVKPNSLRLLYRLNWPSEQRMQ